MSQKQELIYGFNNMINVFEKMRKEINGSILIISHQERILNIADDIIVIENGQVKQSGKKYEILPKLLSAADSCRFYKGE